MNEQTQLKLLTPQVVKTLIEAHRKLAELVGKSVVEKNDDKEKANLVNFIGNTMLEYAPEFLGTWQVMHAEYQPLIKGVGALLMRASAFTQNKPGVNNE